MVFDIYGHLFYAGARTLERQLPDPNGTESPVVVLRMRGYNELGATMIDVLSDYAEKLKNVGGRLYLSGLSKTAYDQVRRADTLELTGPVHAYGAEPIIWQSTSDAANDARTWLVGQRQQTSASNDTKGNGAG